jgi:hypothetical protein
VCIVAPLIFPACFGNTHHRYLRVAMTAIFSCAALSGLSMGLLIASAHFKHQDPYGFLDISSVPAPKNLWSA